MRDFVCMRNMRGCVVCVQVEETEKEREERLKQWENFLEEGEEEKGKEKGESDSTGQPTDQPNKFLCSVLFTVIQFDSIYVGEWRKLTRMWNCYQKKSSICII